MNLLRFRPRTKDLKLPNGALVKVVVNEIANAQNVHDQYDRIHATVRPDPIVVIVRRTHGNKLRSDLGPTNGRKRWVEDEDMRLWVPLPDAPGKDAIATPSTIAVKGNR